MAINMNMQRTNYNQFLHSIILNCEIHFYEFVNFLIIFLFFDILVGMYFIYLLYLWNCVRTRIFEKSNLNQKLINKKLYYEKKITNYH